VQTIVAAFAFVEILAAIPGVHAPIVEMSACAHGYGHVLMY
jgi:hypothetical protein